MSRFRFKPIRWAEDGKVGSPYGPARNNSGQLRTTDPELPRVDEIFQDDAGNLFLHKRDNNGLSSYKRFYCDYLEKQFAFNAIDSSGPYWHLKDDTFLKTRKDGSTYYVDVVDFSDIFLVSTRRILVSIPAGGEVKKIRAVRWNGEDSDNGKLFVHILTTDNSYVCYKYSAKDVSATYVTGLSSVFEMTLLDDPKHILLIRGISNDNNRHYDIYNGNGTLKTSSTFPQNSAYNDEDIVIAEGRYVNSEEGASEISTIFMFTKAPDLLGANEDALISLTFYGGDSVNGYLYCSTSIGKLNDFTFAPYRDSLLVLSKDLKKAYLWKNVHSEANDALQALEINSESLAALESDEGTYNYPTLFPINDRSISDEENATHDFFLTLSFITPHGETGVLFAGSASDFSFGFTRVPSQSNFLPSGYAEESKGSEDGLVIVGSMGPRRGTNLFNSLVEEFKYNLKALNINGTLGVFKNLIVDSFRATAGRFGKLFADSAEIVDAKVGKLTAGFDSLSGATSDEGLITKAVEHSGVSAGAYASYGAVTAVEGAFSKDYVVAAGVQQNGRTGVKAINFWRFKRSGSEFVEDGYYALGGLSPSMTIMTGRMKIAGKYLFIPTNHVYGADATMTLMRYDLEAPITPGESVPYTPITLERYDKYPGTTKILLAFGTYEGKLAEVDVYEYTSIQKARIVLSIYDEDGHVIEAKELGGEYSKAFYSGNYPDRLGIIRSYGSTIFVIWKSSNNTYGAKITVWKYDLNDSNIDETVLGNWDNIDRAFTISDMGDSTLGIGTRDYGYTPISKDSLFIHGALWTNHNSRIFTYKGNYSSLYATIAEMSEPRAVNYGLHVNSDAKDNVLIRANVGGSFTASYTENNIKIYGGLEVDPEVMGMTGWPSAGSSFKTTYYDYDPSTYGMSTYLDSEGLYYQDNAVLALVTDVFTATGGMSSNSRVRLLVTRFPIAKVSSDQTTGCLGTFRTLSSVNAYIGELYAGRVNASSAYITNAYITKADITDLRADMISYSNATYTMTVGDGNKTMGMATPASAFKTVVYAGNQTRDSEEAFYLLPPSSNVISNIGDRCVIRNESEQGYDLIVGYKRINGQVTKTVRLPAGSVCTFVNVSSDEWACTGSSQIGGLSSGPEPVAYTLSGGAGYSTSIGVQWIKIFKFSEALVPGGYYDLTFSFNFSNGTIPGGTSGNYRLPGIYESLSLCIGGSSRNYNTKNYVILGGSDPSFHTLDSEESANPFYGNSGDRRVTCRYAFKVPENIPSGDTCLYIRDNSSSSSQPMGIAPSYTYVTGVRYR